MRRATHTSRALASTCFLVLLLGAASRALANAGGVMVEPISLHFLFGNVILGVIEGLLLAWIVRTRRVWLPILVMIPANFVTFVAGFLVLEPVYARVAGVLDPDPLRAVVPAIVVTGAAAFVVTVLLEWPACVLAMRTRAKGWPGWRRALAACVVVNGATYALLIAWYALASDLTLATQTTRATPAQVLADVPAFDLYALTDHDRHVAVLHWDGRTLTPGEPLSVPEGVRLYDQGIECRAGAAPGTTDLMGRDNEDETLVAEVPGAAPALWHWNRDTRRPEPVASEDLHTAKRLWWSWWETRSAPSDWYPNWFRFRPTVLRVSDSEQDTRLQLACVALPVIWELNGCVALPGDVLLFGIESRGIEGTHENMVYALHVPTRRIALLGRGRTPIAVRRDLADQAVEGRLGAPTPDPASDDAPAP